MASVKLIWEKKSKHFSFKRSLFRFYQVGLKTFFVKKSMFQLIKKKHTGIVLISSTSHLKNLLYFNKLQCTYDSWNATLERIHISFLETENVNFVSYSRDLNDLKNYLSKHWIAGLLFRRRKDEKDFLNVK